jgi:hypothetical protein
MAAGYCGVSSLWEGPLGQLGHWDTSPPCPRTIPNHLNALARILGQLGHIRLGQNQVLGQCDLASSLRAASWSAWT